MVCKPIWGEGAWGQHVSEASERMRRCPVSNGGREESERNAFGSAGNLCQARGRGKGSRGRRSFPRRLAGFCDASMTGGAVCSLVPCVWECAGHGFEGIPGFALFFEKSATVGG